MVFVKDWLLLWIHFVSSIFIIVAGLYFKMAAKLCFLGRWMPSSRPWVAISHCEVGGAVPGAVGGACGWIWKARMWQGHKDGGTVWSVMDLLIGHPEIINFATSFWAGFASHPPHRLHPTTLVSLHRHTVDVGPSTWLRLRTFVMKVLLEPKPGHYIPFHSISAEEDWSSGSIRSVQRGRGSTIQGRQWKQRQEGLNSWEKCWR